MHVTCQVEGGGAYGFADATVFVSLPGRHADCCPLVLSPSPLTHHPSSHAASDPKTDEYNIGVVATVLSSDDTPPTGIDIFAGKEGEAGSYRANFSSITWKNTTKYFNQLLGAAQEQVIGHCCCCCLCCFCCFCFFPGGSFFRRL